MSSAEADFAAAESEPRAVVRAAAFTQVAHSLHELVVLRAPRVVVERRGGHDGVDRRRFARCVGHSRFVRVGFGLRFGLGLGAYLLYLLDVPFGSVALLVRGLFVESVAVVEKRAFCVVGYEGSFVDVDLGDYRACGGGFAVSVYTVKVYRLSAAEGVRDVYPVAVIGVLRCVDVHKHRAVFAAEVGERQRTEFIAVPRHVEKRAVVRELRRTAVAGQIPVRPSAVQRHVDNTVCILPRYIGHSCILNDAS